MKTFISILIIFSTISTLRSQPLKRIIDKEHKITLGLKNAFNKKNKADGVGIFNSPVFHPKFSVDILESSGIHLFTVTNIHPLPSFSVGARFKAGLVITI